MRHYARLIVVVVMTALAPMVSACGLIEKMGNPVSPTDSASSLEPSPGSPATGVVIQIGTGVSEIQRAMAVEALQFAQGALAGIYGVTAEDFFVGIYADIDEAADAYIRHERLPNSEHARVRDMFQSNPVFSSYRSIWRGTWSGDSNIRDSWIHEYTHVVQWELSGRGRVVNAPRWLSEGHAVHAQHRVVSPRTTEWWRERARRAGVNAQLRELEGEYFFAVPDAYFVGALAAEYLQMEHGDRSMTDFWRNLGRSPWQQAFQAAFGITPEAFYETFERRR